jgi:hypothetical protein
MFALGGVGLIGTAFSGRFDHIASSLMAPPVTMVLFLLVFVAFLRRAEPGDVHPDDSERSRAMLLAAVAAAHVTILHVGPALSNLRFIPLLGLDVLLRPLLDLLRLVATAASFGIPTRFLPLIYWLDFAVFASALTYLISNQDEDDNVAAGPAISPRPATPRASFGKRGT